MAAWWRHGAIAGHRLRAGDGSVVRIVFPGHPGGSAGPDFRHAVVEIGGERRAGDIELHLHAANWREHGHATNPAYNGVVLHVVAGGALPAGGTLPLASGAQIPVVALGDVGRFAAPPADIPLWPCRQAQLDQAALVKWLREAGTARFESRVARFRREIAAVAGRDRHLDAALIAAVAEALGYGRQPHATRDAARHLLAGQAHDFAPLDVLSRHRMHALEQWAGEWQSISPAARCCGALLAGGEPAGWARLIALFAPPDQGRHGIGRQRAAIVVWNAVLPFLAAAGDACGNTMLSRLARQVAFAAPGLPSNNVTRFMSRWLRLTRTPSGALAQQGLHHLHAQWCRAKTCSTCPLGRS